MKWSVIFQPENMALYGEGILTTLGLLFSSLGIGAVLAMLALIKLIPCWAKISVITAHSLGRVRPR